MPTFNTTDPKPGYVYDSAIDTWFPLVGIAPASQVDRWTKTAAGGETSLSGNDDNAVSLSYTAGTEQVYLNGVLLVRGQDYTATNGTTITGLTALAASDVAEVVTFNPSNILTTDAVIATDFEAKGDIISASAASTPLRLPVGTNGQVLKANSATTSGLEWGTVDADIEGVTAGTGLTGGGTSGTVTLALDSAAVIAPTIVDAKGDLIVATAADTVSRLAVGATNGHALKVNSATTSGLEWGAAGGELKEVVFTSSNTSYAIPSGVTGIWALIIGGGGGGGATGTATASNNSGGGGAGQVKEAFFAIAGGDTTLNITVGNGGAGGTAGGKGSSGSTSSIVGNTSATTYASATGGGGGGGGTAANVNALSGASAGGAGAATSSAGGGGGGAGGSAINRAFGFFEGNAWAAGQHQAPTTVGVTGGYGGNAGSERFGGVGLNIWGRSVGGGGSGTGGPDVSIAANFGGTSSLGVNTSATNGTANTGGGGSGVGTNNSTARAGGNGGSGLVVLRYVGA